MKLLSVKGVATVNENKTNIRYKFNVPNGISKITIKYSYNPKTVEDRATALSIINDGLKKYNAKGINPESQLPVKNLLTLSFDENGKYRGACHRQANEQEIVIAENNSTAGILNREIEAGEWEICLNAHFIGCDVNYEIEAEGE